MRKSRFTEMQIVSILKETETSDGLTMNKVCQKHSTGSVAYADPIKLKLLRGIMYFNSLLKKSQVSARQGKMRRPICLGQIRTALLAHERRTEGPA